MEPALARRANVESDHNFFGVVDEEVRFAREVRLRPGPGGFIDENADRVVEIRPSWPMAGPNGVRRLTCPPERVGDVVAEVTALARRYGVGLVYGLDEEFYHLEPLLAGHGLDLVEEVATLILPIDAAHIKRRPRVGLRDGLASFAAFVAHHSTVDAAFRGGPPENLGNLAQRYEESRRTPGFFLLTALIDGRPVGGGGLQVWPDGALLGGGAVLPEFRGRGVYRSLVAARCSIARRQIGTPIATHARPQSRPLLEHLGFRVVGGWRSYATGAE